MDRLGWEWGAADPNPPKTQLITSALTLHTYMDTHIKSQEKTSRNKRWASNQRTLQQLNQHRLSDEEEHFWFLWAGAFINHPQKKHHSTTIWAENPLFCFSICRADPRKRFGRRKGGKAIYALFQSIQSVMVSFRVQRFNVSNEHQTSTCGGLIVLCTFPCHIYEERTFHYSVVSYRCNTLGPQTVLCLEINFQNNSQHALWKPICTYATKGLNSGCN